MQELKCPDCGYLNPDIRELGYTLPATCGRCRHIWRLGDVGVMRPVPQAAHAATYTQTELDEATARGKEIAAALRVE